SGSERDEGGMEKVPLHDSSMMDHRLTAPAPSAPPVEHMAALQQSASADSSNSFKSAPLYPAMPAEDQASSSHHQSFSSMPPPPAYDDAMSMPQQAPMAPSGWSAAQQNGASGFPPMPMPTQLPQPPIEQAQTQQHVQPATTIVVTSGGPRCDHCNGFLEMHRDTSMLIFIILCLVFCCPIGIFMLCCVPCTNQRRCQTCHRPG
ncbi:hypothetical protein PFISCL1PPCAC_7164, partial [Pristionchus fissidentatus]